MFMISTADELVTYLKDFTGSKNDDEIKQQVIDYLQDQGVYVGETDNSIVYRNFWQWHKHKHSHKL